MDTKTQKQFEEIAITRATEIQNELGCSKRKAYGWAVNELLKTTTIRKTKKQMKLEENMKQGKQPTKNDLEHILKEIQKYADSNKENNELNMYWCEILGTLEKQNRFDLAIYFANLHGINYTSEENEETPTKNP